MIVTSGRQTLTMDMADAWDFTRDAWRNYKGNSDVNQAAAIAFYAILSLIPLFLLTLLAAGYIFSAHPDVQKKIIGSMRDLHPFFSDDLFRNIMKIKQNDRLVGGVGVISLLWLSAMIFGALEKAFNMIFRARTFRNFITSKLLALAMIPLGLVVSIISVGITYVASAVARQASSSDLGFLSLGYNVPRYLFPYLLTIAFITLLYKIIPNTRISLRGAIGGAVVFATLLEAAKYFFAWYIKNYTHYDVIFGSMETAVLLVIWVFYVAIILLFCAELVSSYERRDLILLEEAFLMPRNNLLKTDERLFRKFGRLFAPGDPLFREGDSGRDMFYILDGEVRVEKKAGHVNKILADIRKGSYLGEMAALINEPRTASAHALVESHVAVINGDVFRNVLRESEGVSLFMLQEFCRRIKHTTDELERVTHDWIKLLVVLYFLKEWPIPEGKKPCEELASLTEKTTAEIDEIFAWLMKEGILLIRDGRAISFDRERVWDLIGKK